MYISQFFICPTMHSRINHLTIAQESLRHVCVVKVSTYNMLSIEWDFKTIYFTTLKEKGKGDFLRI